MLIGFAVLFFTAACHREHNQNDDLPTYDVTLPEKKDTVLNREYIAQIRAIRHIEIRSLDQGYIQKVNVDEGQFVRKGHLLFQIMPTVFQAERQKAQAELSKAEIEFQNTKTLADKNIVSKNELELAKAVLERARAELALADAHLNFTNIKAPFDGIVGRFNDVRLGSLVNEGDLITTLSDNSVMWVYFNVPEVAYLNFIKNNNLSEAKQVVTLKMANGDFFDFSGKVEAIESDFNNETGNIAFRATFPNPKGILRHGQTGNILMPYQLKNAILIPQKASFEVLEKKFVYVIKNGVIESRQITIGQEMPHLYEVKEGLTVQDTVLIDGLRKVKQGDRIRTKYVTQSEILRDLNQIKAE
ncbi:MAG: efflux RND transporter periplasmic adaptor subunit [Chlorobiales bacterium]